MRNQQGQGLIETLVTLLIIVVGVAALIRFQNSMAYSDSIAQQQNDAAILAMDKIESLRDFQVLNNQTGYTSYQSIVSGTSTSVATNTTYTITWTVTAFTNPTYKTIDVSVSWVDRYGTTQTVRLVSRIGGIDPGNSGAVMDNGT